MDILYDEQLAPTPTTYTVQTFYNKYTKEPAEIDLSPTFQREFVWSLKQQAFLVDSILRGLPVPEVYVQETTAADGQQRTIVVDGQQRITSCMRFIDNEFEMPDVESIGSEWKGKLFSELNDEQKKRFRGFSFVVRLLPDKITHEDLRQIFKRLNQTVVALNTSELRNAEYSNDFTALIKSISEASAFSDLGIFSANDYRRKLDEEFVAEVVLVAYSEAFPNKKQGLEEMFRDFDSKPEGTQRDELDKLSVAFGRALDYLSPIASDLKRTRFRNKSDFYSLLSYLVAHADFLDDESRWGVRDALVAFSEEVKELRKNPDDDGQIVLNQSADDYLSAVQRAASDRLNRVSRNNILAEILGPFLRVDRIPLGEDYDVRKWVIDGSDEEEEEPTDLAAG